MQFIFWISLQKKDGRDLTGICYNEVECLLKGGVLSGYCSGGPPVLKGVCCVFIINANNCDTSKVIDSIDCKLHTISIKSYHVTFILIDFNKTVSFLGTRKISIFHQPFVPEVSLSDIIK